MCLLAVMYKIVPGYPVVVAANRDEFLERQGSVPRVWENSVKFVAPKDNRGGGTWIGCNSYETIVAVTNRDKTDVSPKLRSRGLLCTDMLKQAFPAKVAEALQNAVDADEYNSFNLFCIGPGKAFVARYDGRLTITDVDAGVHVIGNGDMDDTSVWKVRRAKELFDACVDAPNNKLIGNLQKACADHSIENQAPRKTAGNPTVGNQHTVCSHGDKRGTLSSTIIALNSNANSSVYLHSQGAPCAAPYSDYSSQLRSILIRAKRR